MTTNRRLRDRQYAGFYFRIHGFSTRRNGWVVVAVRSGSSRAGGLTIASKRTGAPFATFRDPDGRQFVLPSS